MSDNDEVYCVSSVSRGGGGASAVTTVIDVSIEHLRPTGLNARRNFDPDSLAELADSIRQVGVLQPLLVMPDLEEANSLVWTVRIAAGTVDPRERRYLIIAGERRYRAAQIAGLATVPVIVRDRLSLNEISEIMLIENLQRQDLDPIEEARGFRKLLDTGNYTQERLAERLGLTQGHISNRLRLLRLPSEIRESISREILSVSHGLALIRLCPEGRPPSPLLIAAVEHVAAASAKMAIERLDQHIRSAGRSLKPAPPTEIRQSFEHTHYSVRGAAFDLSKCAACGYALAVKHWDGEKQQWCIKPKCWMKQQDRALGVARAEYDAQQVATKPRSIVGPVEREQREAERQAKLQSEIEQRLEAAAVPPSPTPLVDAVDVAHMPPNVTPPNITLFERQLAHSLRTGALEHCPWTADEARFGEVLFDLEFYLPFQALLDHFTIRADLGASRMCVHLGDGDLLIPDQGITIERNGSHDDTPVFLVGGDRLTIEWGRGTVVDRPPTYDVYYRVRVSMSGSYRWLSQLVALPLAGRELYINSRSSTMIRRELLPRWADLLAQLPAMPQPTNGIRGGLTYARSDNQHQTNT